ncbi:pleckstrin homology domain-containing family G member 5 isoform X1 [Athalia rosae]|uniref:pleckstrin homology domain-containing family G member 5 isoform X1 n=2 Tax=Athalia rosae TaxID=37344 RepID=UPI0020332006|nr:pleckstrin homology domain-containing family G member 5 isoform X1 [Athalia rosae]
MTLRKSKKKGPCESTTGKVKTSADEGNAGATVGPSQSKTATKTSRGTKTIRRDSADREKDVSGPSGDNSQGKLSGSVKSKKVGNKLAAPEGSMDRRPSLRRKLGTFIRSSADQLPAAINRGLAPIRRSFSFSKDLDNVHEKPSPYRTRGAHWYNSLVSLAEDRTVDDTKNEITDDRRQRDHGGDARAAKSAPRVLAQTVDETDQPIEDEFGGRILTRAQSLIEKHPATCDPYRRTYRRSRTAGRFPPAPFGRHSDHYDSSVDLSCPPYQATSLPALILHRGNPNENDSASTCFRRRDVQMGDGWGHLKTVTRSTSSALFPHSSPRSSVDCLVRSRSLTQLDALGTSMLDPEEHRLGGAAAAAVDHHQSHGHPHSAGECSPRLLVPNVPQVDQVHSNKARHKLSRSQVSSSEYFSVCFEVGDDVATLDREEFLPATKGTTLAEALSGACDRRGIDLGRIDVFLDAFSTPLPVLTTEASCMGGKHLRVTARDERANSRSSVQKSNPNVSLRRACGSNRGRSGRFFSVSTEDSSVDSEVPAVSSSAAGGKSSSGAAGLKASKQRWSGFFTNTKGTKMESLVEQLNEYTKHGVPKLANIQLPFLVEHDADDEEGFYMLEDDWRDIVDVSDRLTEKQQQQQTALWELAQTEVAYIRTLKVVTDLFMACLCSLQANGILIEVDRGKLFGNIPDIYAANRFFWGEHLLAMVNAARVTRLPLDPGDLLHGFATFEQTFAPYSRYCAEQSRCQQYCRDRLNDNELFTAYLVWCETQKDCNRLRLLDILVKPMQRLTKYSLLLKAVHKNTENEEQRSELTTMIKSVDQFVASVNAALRRNEETARLASAAARLENYDVVESRDEELDRLVKSHSYLDIITAPMPGCPKDAPRTLLREGDLKLRDGATSKMEVRVLLLTDMLLVCKPSTKKTSSSSGPGGGGAVPGGLKIVRQPYVVDKIRVNELKEPSSLGLVYLNDYGSACAALILSAGEPKLAKSWVESLRKAQQQFARMKITSIGMSGPTLPVSRQASTYLGDGDFEVDDAEGAAARTPRGSSRASRVSSLAHSHSGSMEMDGVSPGSSSFIASFNPSRNVSVETNEPPGASSVSSEEGGSELGASGHTHRPLQVRRSLLCKSPTPNTLSVQVPAYSGLGQSLPNLTLATSPQTSTVSPTPPNSLLIVPQITKSKDTLLSPGHRGISYPPPSPPRGALRRAFAVPQSRNPPLIKTRHVNASVAPQPIQPTQSLDADLIEERRRRLEPSARMSSTGSIADGK